MTRFTATLLPVPHGGLFVVVPDEVAARAHLKHASRVRGTVNGIGYRSAVMKYSGIFHLGVPKASLVQAGLSEQDVARLTVELDDEPLPTDTVPPDLAQALAQDPRAQASWEKLAPAHRRGFVKEVLEARKAPTRERRIARIVETLRAGVPKRRTWTPKAG